MSRQTYAGKGEEKGTTASDPTGFGAEMPANTVETIDSSCISDKISHCFARNRMLAEVKGGQTRQPPVNRSEINDLARSADPCSDVPDDELVPKKSGFD